MFNKIMAKVTNMLDTFFVKVRVWTNRHPLISGAISGAAIAEGVIHGVATFSAGYMLILVNPLFAALLLVLGIWEICIPILVSYDLRIGFFAAAR